MNPIRPRSIAFPCRPCVHFVFLVSVLLGLPSQGYGQGAGLGPSLGREPTGVQYPPAEYYAALEIYRTGELDRAIDAFEFAIGRTRRDVNGHWIDAIPPYAMLAECQYKLGDLEGAMHSLDMVHKIAIRYRGWMARPVWNEVLQNRVQLSAKQYLWPEANAVNRVPLARSIKFYSGEQLTEGRLALGGRIEELNIKVIDVVEVMRCIAIASYRRRIILGPLAEGDSLAVGLLDSTKYPAGLQLPIARNLIGAMRASERFGAMEDARAAEDANKYALFGGAVHPITPITTLCAASALAGSDKPAVAVPLCLAVSNQAASMDHFEWIGEALQLAAGCATSKEAPLVQQAGQVAATSLLRKSRLAALHCLLASADAAVTAGDIPTAAARLADANSLAGRRDVLQPRLGAYSAYIAARIAVRSPPTPSDRSVYSPWEDNLNQIVAFATNSRLRKRNLISMPRLYQLQRIRLALGKGLDGQSADVLLAKYADDPSVDVWRRDPVDGIAGVMADRDALRLTRLRTAAARESGQDVLARIEDVQSGRILDQLRLGGRVFQVRALSRMHDDLLDKKNIEFRNKADKPIRDLRAAVIAAAAANPPADPALAQNQIDVLERNAWAIALDRYDLPVVVPHALHSKQPAAEIPDGVGILAFFEDARMYHVVLSTKQKSTYWAIKAGSRVSGEVAALLRAVGGMPQRGARLADGDGWRDESITLRDRLILPGTGPMLTDRFSGIKHLVIIPDGLLWYVPFEVFPTEDRDSVLFGDSVKISYAVSPSMALYPTAMPSDNPAIALAAGRFFAPREAATNESLVQSIVDAVAGGALVRLPEQAVVPTGQSGRIGGHLLVAQATTPNHKSWLDTPIAAYEASSANGLLRSWLKFPSASPSSVMLAGFRSNIETEPPVSGNEIGQTIAALQYSGVRDVIISRWAIGGESTALLMREYSQELPFLGPEQAFERAKSVLRRSELSPLAEPTLTSADHERETLTGNEPFFWSSYLHATPLN